MPTHIIYLLLAVCFETVGTVSMKLSDGFTKWGPATVSILCFAVALFLMSLTLRVMPVGIVYAIWSGLGITFVTLIGYFAFKQSLDIPAILGIGLILSGVIVINVFSNSVNH